MKRLLSLLATLIGGICLLQPPAPAQDKKITKHQAPADQRQHFVLPPGFEIELVAAEPLVINPISMTLDEKGRIYVSESHTYRYGPNGTPVKPFSNPIIRLDPLPDGKGYQRVLVTEGFDDPVMGMAVRNGKLWVTANNFLYRYDLADDGKATNRQTLLTDKNKAWNPFGMFVVEWGPDDMLYLSIGNHAIDVSGTNNKVGSRGGSGIIVRMKPDGSDLERLVQGLRVPYSFEYDPFGQLWLLSNGEGNPNRFVRVIEGVDYHCYSRGAADNNWLLGEHPLSPPCFELPRGACTQLVRYFGSAFPKSYQGSLLLDNWGAHGFDGPNRAIHRYVPDARGKIVAKDNLVSCADPHFRPSHIVVDPDGNLLVSDWYGRDDESDLTGRIWRIKYTGKDKPEVTHKLDAAEWSKLDYAVPALGSPHHLIREKAMNELAKRGAESVKPLAAHASGAKEPMGAANALWTLLRIGTPEAKAALAGGAKHADWRVRRLTVNLHRRHGLSDTAEVVKLLAKDEDPAVRVEAALARQQPEQIRLALLDALAHGAAKDAHLRYEAAWHLAKTADAATFTQLLASADADVRLTGLIALDIACFEAFSSKEAALETLAKGLQDPTSRDLDLLLTLAQLNWDKALVTAVEKLASRADTTPGVTARALVLLRARSPQSQAVIASAGKRFVEAVEQGAIKINSPVEILLLLEFLAAEGPTPFALKQLGGQLHSGNPQVRGAAQELARRFGHKAAPLAPALWPRLFDAKAKPEDRIEYLATVARVEAQPARSNWEKLLGDPQALVRTEAVRWWRSFKEQPEMIALLVERAPELVKQDPALKDELAVVLAHLGVDPAVRQKLDLNPPNPDKKVLTEQTLAALGKLSAEEKQRRPIQGRMVFERNACVQCHTSINQDTPLAPSLKGIGREQKPPYLVESVLEPSRIIKTGFDMEIVITKDGKVLQGLVKDEGKMLRILNLDRDVRIAKTDIEERSVQKASIMPDGQEKLLSPREFEDLIAYLLSLK